MVGQQEDNVGLDMILSSLPNQANHLQASLVDENIITTPLKGQPLHLQLFVRTLRI